MKNIFDQGRDNQPENGSPRTVIEICTVLGWLSVLALSIASWVLSA